MIQMWGEAWAGGQVWGGTSEGWEMFINELMGENPGGNSFSDDWIFVLDLRCSLVKMLGLSGFQ